MSCVEREEASVRMICVRFETLLLTVRLLLSDTMFVLAGQADLPSTYPKNRVSGDRQKTKKASIFRDEEFLFTTYDFNVLGGKYHFSQFRH